MGVRAGLFAAHNILLSLVAHKSSVHANLCHFDNVFYFSYLKQSLRVCDDN
jgi:hypothetical protein